MSTQSKQIFYYSGNMMEKWFFGQYLERLIEAKGWSRNRLAREIGVSSGYITWLLNGYASDKPNPPKPSIDIFLALEKSLNIPLTKLSMAYKGKDPDQASIKDMPEEDLETILKKALELAEKKRTKTD